MLALLHCLQVSLYHLVTLGIVCQLLLVSLVDFGGSSGLWWTALLVGLVAALLVGLVDFGGLWLAALLVVLVNSSVGGSGGLWWTALLVGGWWQKTARLGKSWASHQASHDHQLP